MWKYRVIYAFKDLKDDNYRYSVGDIYPRDGGVTNKERINELKSDKNKIGKPLIKAERVKKDDK